MRVLSTGMIIIACGVAVGGLGCTRTFRATATQPNPVAAPTETLRNSEKVTIVTGDMELDTPYQPDAGREASPTHNRRWPLINQASFTIVSRDRLRFHVQIDHKWEDWADLRNWDVHLEDDQGHRWDPEAVEHAHTKLMSTFWDREQRSAICSGAGRDPTGACITTVGIENDGWKHRQTFGTLSVFRGNADFVFYQRDIMHADVQRLKLVVKHTGEAFEFNWKFHDTVASD